MKRGYQTAAASIPRTSTPSCEAMPAIAPIIARRWSPWDSITPPRRPPVPVTTKPSGRRLDLAAEAAQALDDRGDPVGLLEPQLLCAADHRLALGEAAQQRHERQLVDRERDLVGLDRRPDERPGGDVEVLDGLGRGELVARVGLEVAQHDPAHALNDAHEARRGCG